MMIATHRFVFDQAARVDARRAKAASHVRVRRANGFTLVEVLLALVIMGMIMVSMTQILTAARTSRDTIHNIQETELAGPAILDMLERDLRGITTFDRTRQLQMRVKNRVILGFDADSLDFVSSTDSLALHAEDDRFVRADANEVGYRLKSSSTSEQFLEIYRREAYGIDDDPFEGGTFMLLHDRVKGFDVQCFAKDGTDELPLAEWGASPNDQNIGLPARIEITLTLELAPRLVNEQLRLAPIDKRTMTYKRVIRMPESLRREETDTPIAMIPDVPKPTGGGAGAGGPGGGVGGGKGKNGANGPNGGKSGDGMFITTGGKGAPPPSGGGPK
jgi:prepilin-type N-terminal cleavage/methylation domain-containing protein